VKDTLSLKKQTIHDPIQSSTRSNVSATGRRTAFCLGTADGCKRVGVVADRTFVNIFGCAFIFDAVRHTRGEPSLNLTL